MSRTAWSVLATAIWVGVVVLAGLIDRMAGFLLGVALIVTLAAIGTVRATNRRLASPLPVYGDSSHRELEASYANAGLPEAEITPQMPPAGRAAFRAGTVAPEPEGQRTLSGWLDSNETPATPGRTAPHVASTLARVVLKVMCAMLPVVIIMGTILLLSGTSLSDAAAIVWLPLLVVAVACLPAVAFTIWSNRRLPQGGEDVLPKHSLALLLGSSAYEEAIRERWVRRWTTPTRDDAGERFER